MLLFDSPEHLRNYFSRNQRFLRLVFFVVFGVFFLVAVVIFSLVYGNESLFPEFPLGREAASCSLMSISSGPSPGLPFNALACSQLLFAEEHSSKVAGWS